VFFSLHCKEIVAAFAELGLAFIKDESVLEAAVKRE
jgi:hypothetical protein